MSRFLARIEQRLGAQFPDSYVRTVQAGRLSRYRGGELWTPDECAWIEDTGYAGEQLAKTVLVIGMCHHGDARPLALRRADPTAVTLDEPVYLVRGNGLDPLAASTHALVTPPRKPLTLEQQATAFLEAHKSKRRP